MVAALVAVRVATARVAVALVALVALVVPRVAAALVVLAAVLVAEVRARAAALVAEARARAANTRAAAARARAAAAGTAAVVREEVGTAAVVREEAGTAAVVREEAVREVVLVAMAGVNTCPTTGRTSAPRAATVHTLRTRSKRRPQAQARSSNTRQELPVACSPQRQNQCQPSRPQWRIVHHCLADDRCTAPEAPVVAGVRVAAARAGEAMAVAREAEVTEVSSAKRRCTAPCR